MQYKIKLVVYNEHTIGYINPNSPNNLHVLHASILKGAVFELYPHIKLINKNDVIRLASEKDFNDFRVSFEGYNLNEYEFNVN